MGMVVLAIPVSSMIFKTNIKERITNASDLSGKLAVFQVAHLIKLAVLEATALLAVVSCLVTETTINFIAFGVMIAFMISSAPTPLKIGESLGLSREEINQLEN